MVSGDPYFVSTGSIITTHAMEFVYVLVALGVFHFMKSRFYRTKEFVRTRHDNAIVYFVFLMQLLVVGLVRLCVFLSDKYKNPGFRWTMIAYTLIVALALVLIKLKTAILFAPILVFDMVLFACLPYFSVGRDMTDYNSNMKIEELDVLRLYGKAVAYNGPKKYVNIDGIVGKIQDKANEGLKCSTTRSNTVDPFDFDTVIPFFAADDSNPSTAGIKEFGEFLKSQYMSDNNEYTVLSAETKNAISCKVPFGTFVEDVRVFLGQWDGIVSSNYTKVNVFKLLGAITNLMNVGGYAFFDLFACLTRLNAITDEITDYAAFVSDMGNTTANVHTVLIGEFQEYFSKYAVAQTVTLSEITHKLTNAKCTTYCNRMPVPFDSDIQLDAFDLANAVAMIAADDGYLKFVDVAALIQNLHSVYVAQGLTPIGADAMHRSICAGIGRETNWTPKDVNDADGAIVPILNVRNEIIDIVLTDHAEITVRAFIKMALPFVLHTDDMIAKDTTYAALYTSGDVLKALRPVQDNAQTSMLVKATMAYTSLYADTTSKAGTVVFYYTDDVDLNNQMLSFEQDKKLKESVVVFTWTTTSANSEGTHPKQGVDPATALLVAT